MLYLAIAIYLSFLSWRYDFGHSASKRSRTVHYWIALFILVALSGFRYRLAPDTIAYMEQFKTNIVPLNELSLDYLTKARYLPLWVILNSACKVFNSFTLLQISVAWIFNGCVFYFFRRATTRYFTAILLFFLTVYFYFSMEIMRESLAVAMILVAIVKYNDRRQLAFWGWLIVSAFIHEFAFLTILALPFILTRRIPIFLKVGFSITVIVLLASLVNPLDYIASLSGFLDSRNLRFYDVEREMSLFGVAYNILRIVPIILVLLWYRHRTLPDLLLRKEVIFPLCWTFVFIVVVRITSIPFVDRISNYFVIIVLCCNTAAVAGLAEKKRFSPFRKPLVGTVIVMSFIFCLLPLLSGDPRMGNTPTYRRYYPYSSIYSMQTDPDREYIIYMEAKE